MRSRDIVETSHGLRLPPWKWTPVVWPVPARLSAAGECSWGASGGRGCWGAPPTTERPKSDALPQVPVRGARGAEAVARKMAAWEGGAIRHACSDQARTW